MSIPSFVRKRMTFLINTRRKLSESHWLSKVYVTCSSGDHSFQTWNQKVSEEGIFLICKYGRESLIRPQKSPLILHLTHTLCVVVCCCVQPLSHVRLCDPMNWSLSGSSVQGISQARIREWLPCPPPGDLPDPGVKSLLSHLLNSQLGSLTAEPPGRSHCSPHHICKYLAQLLIFNKYQFFLFLHISIPNLSSYFSPLFSLFLLEYVYKNK